MPGEPITIIVPTYNRAHLIARALKSVANQCLPQDEVIVVDDASTDDTERVVSDFPGVRYERITHGGAGKARNTGVSLARHSLVAFLDSDDELLPGTLDCRRALMGARKDLTFCFTNFSGQADDGPIEPACLIYWSHDPRDWGAILSPGRPLSDIVPHRCQADPLVHVGSIYRDQMANSYVAANTIVVNRDNAGDALRFPEDLPTYEDWECFGRLAGSGPCAFLAFDSAIQHRHGGPRLTDAKREVEVRTRLKILARVWGSDTEFMATYATDYERVCTEQRLLGARVLILDGRLKEARDLLSRVPGGPLWARLARRVPVPRAVLTAWKAMRHWRG
jgi:glycosyltransferase involved in cell wall biosynthesis